jgi:hypothetical protein
LKVFGFDFSGTAGNNRSQWSHPLFTRDFPALWNLEEDEELNDKVVLSIFLKLKSETKPREVTIIGKGCDWENYPPLHHVLCEYMRRFYRVLTSTNCTKQMAELLQKITVELRTSARTHGFEFAKEFDDRMIVSSIQRFFRLGLENSRKKMLSLKVSTSVEDKFTLQTLILQAANMKIDDVSLAIDDQFLVVQEISNTGSSIVSTVGSQKVDTSVRCDIQTNEDMSASTDRRSTQSSPSVVSADSFHFVENHDEKLYSSGAAIATTIVERNQLIDAAVTHRMVESTL